MKTFIVTAKRGKDLRTNLEDHSISNRLLINDNEFFIVKTTRRDVKLVLLPDLDTLEENSGFRRKKVIYYIKLLIENKTIDNNSNETYLILHANDFRFDGSNSTGIKKHIPSSSPFSPYNGRVVYYTSEVGDNTSDYAIMIKHDPSNDNYFDLLSNLFQR